MDGSTLDQKNIEDYARFEGIEPLKISVIIPVYNCREFLPECLNSVTGQTYGKLEIILIDDGSDDGCQTICDEWKSRDDRILVVHQKNRGVSAARNRGIELATGDVLSFVDADDTLDSDMYEFLIGLMQKYQADISHCGYKHIVGDEVRLVHDTKQIYEQDATEALRCLVGSELFVGSLWNKLYRVSLVAKLRFREDIRINEDILYNFEAFRSAKKTVFADFAKYNYIAHKTSSACFVTAGVDKAADACKVNQYIYSQLQDSELVEDAAERYLRSLSVYYRELQRVKKKTQQKGITEEAWRVYSSCAKQSLSLNMRITAILMKYIPVAYRAVYFAYDKIRKPNWEV